MNDAAFPVKPQRGEIMKHAGRLRCNEKGFTLVEAMVALLLISMGLLSVAAMQAFYVKQTFQAQQMFAADTLSTQVMEIILNNPTQVAQIPRMSIYSCTGAGWTQEVCDALREALLRDELAERLKDAELEVIPSAGRWVVTIYWKVGSAERNVSTSIRL